MFAIRAPGRSTVRPQYASNDFVISPTMEVDASQVLDESSVVEKPSTEIIQKENTTSQTVVDMNKKEERGEKGEKGEKGEQGEKGERGFRGPKVVLWSGEIALHTPTPQKICILPYNGVSFTLSNFDFVAEGTGSVLVYLTDKISGSVVYQAEHVLGDIENIYMFNITDFNELPNTYTILELTMALPQAGNVKIMCAEFTI